MSLSSAILENLVDCLFRYRYLDGQFLGHRLRDVFTEAPVPLLDAIRIVLGRLSSTMVALRVVR